MYRTAGLILLLGIFYVKGRNLESWTSHEVSPLGREDEEKPDQVAEPTNQDIVVFLPEASIDTEIKTDDGRSDGNEEELPEEHLVVIVDEKEFPPEKFEALKLSSDPLSVLFPTDSNSESDDEEQVLSAERLPGFIQDRIPSPSSDASSNNQEPLAISPPVQEDEAKTEILSDQIGDGNAKDSSVFVQDIENERETSNDVKISNLDFVEDILTRMVKTDVEELSRIVEAFPVEFHQLIAALEKEASALEGEVPTFISNLAYQYGGGGPLSILLTGGGMNEILQSLSQFGPSPGSHSFYGSPQASSGGNSPAPGNVPSPESSAPAGAPHSQGLSGIPHQTMEASEPSEGTEHVNADATSGSSSENTNSNPTSAPTSNATEPLSNTGMNNTSVSGTQFQQFCVVPGRLCQAIIALQPCCSGKPCQPFSQSFLNAFAMGNVGVCV